jgi:hypothetical protein
MTKLDDIYEAVDDFGLITSAEARELGVSNAELVQYADRGRLTRVARGVYQMPVWPYQEEGYYAIVVRAAGDGAYLLGESVVALLDLAPTDPRRLWIGTPRRVRRNVGVGIKIVHRPSTDVICTYRGVPCQSLKEAIELGAKMTMGPDRANEAAINGMRLGYLTEQDVADIQVDWSQYNGETTK